MTFRAAFMMLLTLLGGIACRTPATGRPVIDMGEKPPTMEGTIAGHVRAAGGAPVVSRVVRAISLDSGKRYEVSTNSAGTYSVKVPPGRYRIEVDLRGGERLARQPDETTINASDLDPDRDFEIAPAP